jgi:hypothetical protein
MFDCQLHLLLWVQLVSLIVLHFSSPSAAVHGAHIPNVVRIGDGDAMAGGEAKLRFGCGLTEGKEGSGDREPNSGAADAGSVGAQVAQVR